jgi:hypothetical protein
MGTNVHGPKQIDCVTKRQIDVRGHEAVVNDARGSKNVPITNPSPNQNFRQMSDSRVALPTIP